MDKRTNKRTETHACDCVDRQAAIEELDRAAWGVDWDKALAKTMLEALPTVQPEVLAHGEGELSAQLERKKGKWIYGEDEYGIDGYHCDKCGFFVPWDYAHKFINYIEDYNFCPNCGADMRGKDNG